MKQKTKKKERKRKIKREKQGERDRDREPETERDHRKELKGYKMCEAKRATQTEYLKGGGGGRCL